MLDDEKFMKPTFGSQKFVGKPGWGPRVCGVGLLDLDFGLGFREGVVAVVRSASELFRKKVKVTLEGFCICR